MRLRNTRIVVRVPLPAFISVSVHALLIGRLILANLQLLVRLGFFRKVMIYAG